MVTDPSPPASGNPNELSGVEDRGELTGNRRGSNHASVTRFGGRFGRGAPCCAHAAAGAGTRNRWVFRRLFERHGGGENQRTGALLRARQRQGRALSGRRG